MKQSFAGAALANISWIAGIVILLVLGLSGHWIAGLIAGFIVFVALLVIGGLTAISGVRRAGRNMMGEFDNGEGFPRI